MYRGGRPNRAARALNRVAATLFSRGLLFPGRGAALEVAGRRSGRPVTVPVVITDLAGERYLVSMLGEQANWVGNVRAAAGRAILRHGRREALVLEEVEVPARAPILRRYLAVAPGARPHIPVERRAPLAEFERVARLYPVFRLTAAPQPAEQLMAPLRDAAGDVCAGQRPDRRREGAGRCAGPRARPRGWTCAPP